MMVYPFEIAGYLGDQDLGGPSTDLPAGLMKCRQGYFKELGEFNVIASGQCKVGGNTKA